MEHSQRARTHSAPQAPGHARARVWTAVRHAALALTLALALGAVTTAPAAHAIPPGGASPDTPGTSSSVSPTTLAPGSTISFTVSGFPPGETVYIKIDDGLSCGASAVHGACVYHQQAINSSGTASGSFVLPSDITPGAHWLRFLASREIFDDNGNYLGVEGFTRRGGADFTVVAASSGSGGSSSAGASSDSTSGEAVVAPGSAGQALPGAGQTQGEGAETLTGAGGVVQIEPGEAEATQEPSVEPSEEPSAVPSPSAPSTVVAEATQEGTPAAAASAPDEGGFPMVGAAGFAVLALAAGTIAFLAARGKRPPTPGGVAAPVAGAAAE